MRLLVVVKSDSAYKKIQQMFAGKYEILPNISHYQELQEFVIGDQAEYAILDNTLHWRDRADKLLTAYKTPVVNFKGNFDDLMDRIEGRRAGEKKSVATPPRQDTTQQHLLSILDQVGPDRKKPTDVGKAATPEAPVEHQPKEIIKEVIREVPVERIVEKEIEVIKEVPVDRVVEKEIIREVPVEVIREVPIERIVERPVEVIKEVPVEVVREVVRPSTGFEPNEIIKEAIEELGMLPGPPKQQKVIVKDRIVGPILIAVGGSDRRSGSSHAVLKIGRVLAAERYKVACVELPRDPQTSIFYLYDAVDSQYLEGGYSHEGIDLFPYQEDAPGQMVDLYTHYDYIVADMGTLFHQSEPHPNLNEFLRAHVRIVTTGCADWDFDQMTQLIGFFKSRGLHNPVHFLLNFANEKRVKKIRDTFSANEIKELRLRFLQSPFEQTNDAIGEQAREFYLDLLEPVLPEKRGKKRWFGRR